MKLKKKKKISRWSHMHVDIKNIFRTKRCHKENGTCIDLNVSMSYFLLSTSDNTWQKTELNTAISEGM